VLLGEAGVGRPPSWEGLAQEFAACNVQEIFAEQTVINALNLALMVRRALKYRGQFEDAIKRVGVSAVSIRENMLLSRE